MTPNGGGAGMKVGEETANCVTYWCDFPGASDWPLCGAGCWPRWTLFWYSRVLRFMSIKRCSSKHFFKQASLVRRPIFKNSLIFLWQFLLSCFLKLSCWFSRVGWEVKLYRRLFSSVYRFVLRFHQDRAHKLVIFELLLPTAQEEGATAWKQHARWTCYYYHFYAFLATAVLCAPSLYG